MTGTAKQIAWAEQIKTDALNTLDANIARTATEKLFEADHQSYRLLKALTIMALEKIQDAGTLIDRRRYFDPAQLTRTAAKWAEDLRTGKITVEKLAEVNHVTNW